MHYIYDGSFDGLLTVIYEHAYTEKAEEISIEGSDMQLSLGSVMHVAADTVKSEKVASALEKKVSPAALRRAYRAYLTAEDGREMDILEYVFLAFKIGRDVDRLHGDPIVRRIDVLNHKVSWETEKFLGILRFSVIADDSGREVLYAPIKPNCDIIQAFMPHFLNRYRQEPFIIHDVGREKAAFAENGEWIMRQLSKDFSPEYTKDELQYQQLWKNYFKTAGISQRTNPQLQKHFVPTRYWQYMTEL